jgi:hypothetical protein
MGVRWDEHCCRHTSTSIAQAAAHSRWCVLLLLPGGKAEGKLDKVRAKGLQGCIQQGLMLSSRLDAHAFAWASNSLGI